MRGDLETARTAILYQRHLTFTRHPEAPALFARASKDARPRRFRV